MFRALVALLALVCLNTTAGTLVWDRYVSPMNSDVYAMDDSGEVFAVTDHPQLDRSPKASADGEWVVYQGKTEGGDSDIFICPLVRGGGRDRENISRRVGIDMTPAWSPSGNHIVYSSWDGPDNNLWISNRQGTIQRQFTDAPRMDWYPDWSPDGKWLAWTSDRHGSREVFVAEADADDRDAVQLTENSASGMPAWSPDGKQIAFISGRTAFLDIWIMDADGAGQENLTESAGEEWHPTWMEEDLVWSVGIDGLYRVNPNSPQFVERITARIDSNPHYSGASLPVQNNGTLMAVWGQLKQNR